MIEDSSFCSLLKVGGRKSSEIAFRVAISRAAEDETPFPSGISDSIKISKPPILIFFSF